ncbi:limbin [Protopterus annectens]|uniref:limbin n=1 Tax=Protopterus annectens TaxID=7888 RepID=UPI001CFA02B7|nr:limbin [Protopterus annectens]
MSRTGLQQHLAVVWRNCPVKCQLLSIEVATPLRRKLGLTAVMVLLCSLYALRDQLQGKGGRYKSQNPKDKNFTDMNYCFSPGITENDQYLSILDRRKELFKEMNLALPSAASGGPQSHSIFTFSGSWGKSSTFLRKQHVLLNYKQKRALTKTSVASFNGLIFQKCAQVNSQNGASTIIIQLIINSTTVSAPVISQLTIKDITDSLTVKNTSGTRTEPGLQTYIVNDLQAGSSFVTYYTAVLNDSNAQEGKILSLPAYLTYRNSSHISTLFGPLNASFTIMEQAHIQGLPDHGIHFVGFIVAFIISFALTCGIISAVYLIQRPKTRARNSSNPTERKRIGLGPRSKSETSEYESLSSFKDDLALEERILDLFVYEDIDNMLDSLEELDTTSRVRADAVLENHRIHISKDLIFILLRNRTTRSNFPVFAEKKLRHELKQKLVEMDRMRKAEAEERLLAVTTECNRYAEQEMAMQQQRHMAAEREAEQMLKHIIQKEADLEYRTLLDKLNSCETRGLQRFLLSKQQEATISTQRHSVIHWRMELHKIFFAQIKESTEKQELHSEAAKHLLKDYSEVQKELEDLMDYLLANQRKNLWQRFFHRKYLVHNLRSCKNRNRALMNKASTHIGTLINKIENSGRLTKRQSEALLEKIQTEILNVKQSLDENFNQKQKSLHQQLAKRQHSIAVMFQQHQQSLKHLTRILDTSRNTINIEDYLNQWKNVLSSHTAELTELVEKFDSDAVHDLKALQEELAQNGISNIRNIQVKVIEHLASVGIPKNQIDQLAHENSSSLRILFENQNKEEEKEESAANAILQTSKQNLEKQFEREVKEQRLFRQWEAILFTYLLRTQFSLSEDELLKLTIEFHNIFSQMDNCLALPNIRTRYKLQKSLTEWRNKALKDVDHSMLTENKKQESMHRKQWAGDAKAYNQMKIKIETLTQYTEEKIHIFEKENSLIEAHKEKANSELLLERTHQQKLLEEKLGVHIAGLQFQKADKSSRTLEISAALLHLQSLLLEELNVSKPLMGSDSARIIEGHIHETEVLQRKLQSEELEKEAALQQYIMKNQKQVTNGVGLAYEFRVVDEERRVSVILQEALHKCEKIISLQRQRAMEEKQNYRIVEDLKEHLEQERIFLLHCQERKLTAYFVKQSGIPVGVLNNVLHLLLPTCSEKEIVSILDSVYNKYPICDMDNDKNRGANSTVKRKPETSARLLDVKLRKELIDKYMDKTCISSWKKGSLVKKKQLQPWKRVSFSHMDSFPKFSSTISNHPSQVKSGLKPDVIDLPDTGEKVFVFRQDDSISTFATHSKKKKKNFLNLKKSAVASFDI